MCPVAAWLRDYFKLTHYAGNRKLESGRGPVYDGFFLQAAPRLS